MNAQFIKCLDNALDPLERALRTQPRVLSVSPYSADFNLADFRSHLQSAEAGITPLAASARLMRRDISYGRFNGEDLKELHNVARQLFVRREFRGPLFCPDRRTDSRRGHVFLFQASRSPAGEISGHASGVDSRFSVWDTGVFTACDPLSIAHALALDPYDADLTSTTADIRTGHLISRVFAAEYIPQAPQACRVALTLAEHPTWVFLRVRTLAREPCRNCGVTEVHESRVPVRASDA